MMRSLILLAGMAGIASAQTNAPGPETHVLRSGMKQVPLIELFTSEGCSSCPPADRWISSLTGNAGLWRDFVPAVFHVDYWDGLGWPDRFASANNTLRQHAYAESWKSDSVYTPAFVLNGKEWRSGLAGRAIPRPGADAGVLEVKPGQTNHFAITFTPAPGIKGPFDVSVAWLAGNLATQVRRGENAGRTLEHNFVVLAWATIPLNAESAAHGNVLLKRPTGTDATKLALAAWVTPRGSRAAIQSAGAWWP